MFARLVHIPLEAFLNEYWSKKHSTWTTPFFKEIAFNKQELFKLIQENKISPLDLTLISRDSLLVNPISGDSIKPYALQDILKLIQGGYTLRIRHLDKYNSFLNKLKTSLTVTFQGSININCYYSQTKATGILPHYDAHHIFIIQTDGSKTWYLGDMQTNHPRPGFTPNQFQDSMSILSTLYLTRGKILYLPKGLMHYTRTKQESLHITVGIHQKDYSDWFKESLDKIMKLHPLLRKPLPLVINEDGLKYEKVPHSTFELLYQLLEKELYNKSRIKK